jgi:hypothetical protein
MNKTYKRAAWVSAVALIIAVAAWLTYKRLMQLPIAVPERPASVPGSATWVGGNKGEWIDCAWLNERENTLKCETYNDVKGEKLASGSFWWQRESSSAPASRLPTPRYVEGEVIVTDQGKLLPIGKHVFFGPSGDSWTKEYQDLGER